MGTRRRRMPSAFLDEADAVAFGVVHHGDPGAGFELGGGLERLGAQPLGLLDRLLEAGHRDVERHVLAHALTGGEDAAWDPAAASVDHAVLHGVGGVDLPA